MVRHPPAQIRPVPLVARGNFCCNRALMAKSTNSEPGKSKPGQSGEGRDRAALKRERLARALRENLKRRKDRGRGQGAKDDSS